MKKHFLALVALMFVFITFGQDTLVLIDKDTVYGDILGVGKRKTIVKIQIDTNIVIWKIKNKHISDYRFENIGRMNVMTSEKPKYGKAISHKWSKNLAGLYLFCPGVGVRFEHLHNDYMGTQLSVNFLSLYNEQLYYKSYYNLYSGNSWRSYLLGSSIALKENFYLGRSAYRLRPFLNLGLGIGSVQIKERVYNVPGFSSELYPNWMRQSSLSFNYMLGLGIQFKITKKWSAMIAFETNRARFVIKTPTFNPIKNQIDFNQEQNRTEEVYFFFLPFGLSYHF